MDAREVCFQIAREHADGVRSAIDARRRMRAADAALGVSLVVGGYRERSGTLRLIAVRRSQRDRLDVVEVSSERPTRVLHTVHGEGEVAERRAFAIAELHLAEGRRAA